MNNNTLKRKLSKAYDEKRLEVKGLDLSWTMYAWQHEHCKNGFAQYTNEQYHRALKKRVIEACLDGRATYIIKEVI